MRLSWHGCGTSSRVAGCGSRRSTSSRRGSSPRRRRSRTPMGRLRGGGWTGPTAWSPSSCRARPARCVRCGTSGWHRVSASVASARGDGSGRSGPTGSANRGSRSSSASPCSGPPIRSSRPTPAPIGSTSGSPRWTSATPKDGSCGRRARCWRRPTERCARRSAGMSSPRMRRRGPTSSAAAAARAGVRLAIVEAGTRGALGALLSDVPALERAIAHGPAVARDVAAWPVESEALEIARDAGVEVGLSLVADFGRDADAAPRGRGGSRERLVARPRPAPLPAWRPGTLPGWGRGGRVPGGGARRGSLRRRSGAPALELSRTS